jgi:transcriptional regulator with XRE-family HTH domain
MEDPQPGSSSRVKRLRTERAWTQEQLAKICGVSVRTIQRLETGEKMSFETLKAIATAFDLDVRDLYSTRPSIELLSSALWTLSIRRQCWQLLRTCERVRLTIASTLLCASLKLVEYT